jgi:hypothetical protein
MIEKKIAIQIGHALTLVDMSQDVALVGWDEDDVLLRLEGDREEDLTIEPTEAGPAVSARGTCQVRVPRNVPVAVQQLRANLRAEGLEHLAAEEVRGNANLSEIDEATLSQVYGNLRSEGVTSLRTTGVVYGNATLQQGAAELLEVRGNLHGASLDELRASRVGGNLTALEIDGPITVERVGGNAALKGIGGLVTLDKVSGNLTAKDLGAGAKAPKIGGNVVLNGEIGAGSTYHFRAGGNALLRLSEDASTHLTLRAKGLIRTSPALAGKEQEGTTVTGTLGDGGAELVVEVDGNLLMGTAGPSLGSGLGEEISRQIEESLRAIDLEAVGQEISAEMERAMSRLRIKLESVDWERVGRRTERSLERAMERMQRDIDRLTEKAQRRQEKLERMAQRAAHEKERMERAGSGPSEHAGTYFAGYRESDEPGPSLDQERLTILKMVEQGKITSEEAEKLLDALE